LPGAERYVLALAQDMTISREAFLRSLAVAVEHTAFDCADRVIRPRDPAARWRIVIAPLDDLALGALSLPRQRVEIYLRDCSDDEQRRFLERFELAFRRAGG